MTHNTDARTTGSPTPSFWMKCVLVATRASPRRLSPRQCRRWMTFGSFAANPTPQILSIGDASTSALSLVPIKIYTSHTGMVRHMRGGGGNGVRPPFTLFRFMFWPNLRIFPLITISRRFCCQISSSNPFTSLPKDLIL